MDTLTPLLIRDVSEAATDLALRQMGLFEMHMNAALRRIAPYVDEVGDWLDLPVPGSGEEDSIAAAECLSEAFLALTMRDRPSVVFIRLLEALSWSHAGIAQRSYRELLALYRFQVR